MGIQYLNFLIEQKTLYFSIEHVLALNSLPNDKLLDQTKLKAFGDNKLNVAKMTISLYNRVENTVVKGENAGYQHFLPFQQCFPRPSSEIVKSRDCVGKS